jgi:hypothetical protein
MELEIMILARYMKTRRPNMVCFHSYVEDRAKINNNNNNNSNIGT